MTFREHRGDTPDEDRRLGTVEGGVIHRVNLCEFDDEVRWDIGYGDHWGISLPDRGVEPKPGDRLETFGSFGRPVHGYAINGVVFDYRSREEMDAEHKAMVERMDAKRRADFAEKKDDLDREYDALPALFKMRIDRFRDANPDFRWQHEPYEMFVCSQAALLAEWAREQDGDPVEAIDAWDRINSKDNDPPYDYQAQLAAVPGWADGHSGNTHGWAVALAKQYLTTRERVPLLPGAMSPILGTADYSAEVIQ